MSARHRIGARRMRCAAERGGTLKESSIVQFSTRCVENCLTVSRRRQSVSGGSPWPFEFATHCVTNWAERIWADQFRGVTKMMRLEKLVAASTCRNFRQVRSGRARWPTLLLWGENQ